MVAMSRVHKDGYVGGALALILHVSRLFGIAPLRMDRELGRWRVSVSTAAGLYSYAILLCMHGNILINFVIEMCLYAEKSVFINISAIGIPRQIRIIIVQSVVTIGVVGAKSRMKEMIECLNIIEKVNIKSMNVDWQSGPGEKKRCIGTIVYLLVVNLLHIQYLCAVLNNVWIKELNGIISASLAILLSSNITLILEMQFFFIALHATFALKFVNDSLSDLICTFDLKSPTITIKRAQEKVRCLMLSFGAICDVIRQINASYEKILLLLIGTSFLHLVATPHLLLTFLFSQNYRLKDVILQGFLLLLHTSYLIVAVEPGHRTEQELERTSILVSKLLHRVSSPRDSLAQELDVFYKQITLNKVSYMPLGMCTLARPLIIAVCGGVTTYLVIILQLQALIS